MAGSPLSAVVAFVRVAHHASFTRAAAELGVSPSALSQTVRALEAQLGVRLL
ncbi:LysR family transcriptional regulator, partial [Xanthomonas sp. Kuri4-2]